MPLTANRHFDAVLADGTAVPLPYDPAGLGGGTHDDADTGGKAETEQSHTQFLR